MGGEGHIFDMVNRSRENRRLLQVRREQIRNLRKNYLAHDPTKTSKHAIPPNLEKIQEEIRKELYRKKRKAWTITGCILIALISCILILALSFQWEIALLK